MVAISLGWMGTLLGSLAAPRLGRLARFVLPALAVGLLWLGRDLPPGFRLLASSLLLMYALKGASATRDPRTPRGPARLLAMVVWPGFDHERFAERAEPAASAHRRFVNGLLWCYAGGFGILALALLAPRLGAATGWLGIAAILAFLHFGFSNILTSLLWLFGFPVRPLFDDPFRSRSLREFWTARWNLAFVEMDRRLFLPPLTRWLGLRGAVFGVFLVSGLLHEVAISYPAGAGWGGPMAYFALQGLLVLFERKILGREREKSLGRLWTFVCVLAPLPLLFHTPFRETLIRPFFLWLNGLLTSHPVAWWFDKGLWALGAFQLCVLMASFQVPIRLRWREELPRLSPFNQKLMWTQGGFIVLTILGFATATLLLHGNMLAGEPGALAIAGFAATFWSCRLLCDAFYFRSEDWPEGPQFGIGHALLNSLFSLLVLGYGGLVVWHLLGRPT